MSGVEQIRAADPKEPFRNTSERFVNPGKGIKLIAGVLERKGNMELGLNQDGRLRVRPRQPNQQRTLLGG